MKKTMQLSMLMLAITGITVFNSCKKDKGDDSSGKSKTELLTTGKWKVTAYTVNDQNFYDDFVEDCSKDDFATFSTNGTGVIDEGSIKCDVDQTYPFEWAFSSNETKITYDGTEYTVATLNSGTLKLSNSTTINGITITEALTFSH